MLYSLLITAFLMGLAGLPHCATMCAAPCAAVMPHGVSGHAVLGRTLGYAVLGGVAAGAMSLVAAWSRWATALQPIWVMVLAATFLLGLWMVASGAMPAAVQAHGTALYRRVQAWGGGVPTGPSEGTALRRQTWRPVALGMAWAALPCGLLYGAVMTAALAPTPAQGALVMAVFSLPGAVVLWWLPARLKGWRWPARLSTRWPWLADPRWAVRLAGGLLSAAAAWGLAHRLHEQWLAWCA
jgi:sulfite exporter TauE/SafE